MAGHFYDDVTSAVRSIEEAESQPIGPKKATYARLMAGFLADENSLLVSFPVSNPRLVLCHS
jgi:hypothetical protein